MTISPEHLMLLIIVLFISSKALLNGHMLFSRIYNKMQFEIQKTLDEFSGGAVNISFLKCSSDFQRIIWLSAFSESILHSFT
jgi:hypothetical protein